MMWEDRLLVELTSAEGVRALEEINGSGIPVFGILQNGPLTASFWIRRRDIKKLRKLSDKRGDRLTVLRKRGMQTLAGRLLQRPVLIFGIAFLFGLSLYVPSRVLFIRVEGNIAVPARRILTAAEDCGIGFGASRKEVRSEKTKNALLGAIPELSWAGVNTSGCTAVISVRERTASREAAPPFIPAALEADRDGFILSANVTRGTALIRPGQAVRKGQMLVSGYMDSGISIRFTGADGEIFAQTRRNFRAIAPVREARKRDSGEILRKFSLRFRKKRINLWKDSGICGATCGRMYKEFCVTLPGGFQLPLALCVETFFPYTLVEGEVGESRAEEGLAAFAKSSLLRQMVSGEILGGDTVVTREGETYLLEGTFDCREMIGRARKIGEENGKRD